MPAILCPRCRRLIDSTAAHCPFCGQSRPGLWNLGSRLSRLVRVDFSRLIVTVCVALYVLCLLSDPAAIFQFRNPMNILAPSMNASFRFGMTGKGPVMGLGYWWTLVTAIYLHGGLLHILFNMLWVRQLGPLVEELFGPFRLFTIFTVSGAAGFALSAFMGTNFTLGASGSIFGLLAAAVVYGRKQGSSLFTRQFLQWAVIMFVFGFIFPGVDNWAHLGGFAGGYLTSLLFSRRWIQPEGPAAYLAAGVCLLLTLAAFVLQFLAMLRLPF